MWPCLFMFSHADTFYIRKTERTEDLAWHKLISAVYQPPNNTYPSNLSCDEFTQYFTCTGASPPWFESGTFEFKSLQCFHSLSAQQAKKKKRLKNADIMAIQNVRNQPIFHFFKPFRIQSSEFSWSQVKLFGQIAPTVLRLKGYTYKMTRSPWIALKINSPMKAQADYYY